MPPGTPREPTHRQQRWRRVRSWLILLVVVPLLAMLGLLALVSSPAGNRWLLRQAIEAADLFLPGASLQVGDLETDLLRHLRLRELRLVADDGDILVSVAEIELLWRPVALLRREVRVDRLVLTRPVVNLEVDPDGRVDLLEALGLGGDDPEPDSGPWQGSPVSVRLERAHVVDGRVQANLEAAEGSGNLLQIGDLEVALSVALLGRELSVERAVLAAEAGYQRSGSEPVWLPIGLGGGVRLVDLEGAFPLQDLLVDDLRLKLGSAVAGAQGRVAGVGGEESLALELALRDLYPGELSFLTGELGVAGPFALEASLRGPAEALELLATVHCPDDAGTLRLGLGANTTAPELTWLAQVRLDAVQPHRFVQALPEPFLLHGGLFAEGQGTSWPDGLEAEVGLALEPGVAWGVDFAGLSAKVRAADGSLWFDQVAFASALGRGSLSGQLDPAAASAQLGYRIGGLPLARLADFGVSGLRGSARSSGRAELGFGGGVLDVGVDGELVLGGAGYGGLVRADALSSPIGLRYAGGALQLEGVMTAAGVDSQGALARTAQGPWRFDLDPAGAMSWQAELVAAGVGYGVITVEEVRAAVGGSQPADGPLELLVGFDARGLEAPNSAAPQLRADRAAGQLELVGDRLEFVVQAKEGERSVVEAELVMDLVTGTLELPTLLIAPTVEATWRAVEPVQATLVSGGLRGLRLQLRSGEALVWGMGDFDPSGPVDLRLMASDLTLDPLVPIFPGLPRGLSGTTRLAVQVTGSADALAVAGSAEVEGLVVPGSVRALDARLVLRGDGHQLGFQLDIPEPSQPVDGDAGFAGSPGQAPSVEQTAPTWSSASMLFASGTLPLSLAASGVALDPQAPWELDLLLAPGELERFGWLLELEPLPAARLSAHAMVGGTPEESTLALTGAVDLPLGEDAQRVRVELDLVQAEGRAELELVVAQHMLRQAELLASANTELPRAVHEQVVALFGGTTPSGAAPLDLADAHTWVGEVHANLVPLGISTEVLGRVLPLPEGIDGSLVGGLQVQGDPLRPAVSGALQLVDARVGDVGIAPALVTLMPAAGGYDLGVNLGFAGGGSLLVAGFAPLDLDLEDRSRLQASLERQGLELEVGGTGVPLGALATFVGGAEDVVGLVQLGGRLSGSALDPLAELQLTLDGGSMVLSDLGVRYDEIRVSASVVGKLVQLDELRLRSRPAFGGSMGLRREASSLGVLELSGSAMLDGWVPDAVDLRGDADHFWAIDTVSNRLSFSGDFAASGRWPALDITGDVTVADARFVLDDAMFLYSGTLELDPRLQVHRGLAAAPLKEAPAPPFYREMEVDLRLDLARATTVQVEMPFDDKLGALWASALSIVLEARLDGLLDVGYRHGMPTVLGEVEPVWGRADILGSRFALGDGVISFVGDDPFDPILELEAVHNAGSYGDVGVDITGSLADMGLGFRSESYPDETDIVSILLLGAPLSELSSGQAQGNASLLTIASGVLMGELERQGGGGHIVDMVELGGGSAKAGRALGDDIFVTLELAPGAEVDQGENITEVTVDWTISRAWSAEIVTGDQGTSSADLYWTWRF